MNNKAYLLLHTISSLPEQQPAQLQAHSCSLHAFPALFSTQTKPRILTERLRGPFKPLMFSIILEGITTCLVTDRCRTQKYSIQTAVCLPFTWASRIFITSSFSFISSLETSSLERLAISCAIFVSHSCQRKRTVLKRPPAPIPSHCYEEVFFNILFFKSRTITLVLKSFPEDAFNFSICKTKWLRSLLTQCSGSQHSLKNAAGSSFTWAFSHPFCWARTHSVKHGVDMSSVKRCFSQALF